MSRDYTGRGWSVCTAGDPSMYHESYARRARLKRHPQEATFVTPSVAPVSPYATLLCNQPLDATQGRHGEPTAHQRNDRFCHHREQIPQAEDRYDLYLENKSWEKAAEAAARLKDPRCVVQYTPSTVF